MNKPALTDLTHQDPETYPNKITLRGACGPGFGRGQLLVRFHRTDPNRPYVVERAFLPSNISSHFTTKPFAWQTRKFKPDSKLTKDWAWAIAEVMVSTVDKPMYQLEDLEGHPLISAWHPLNINMFRMDDVTMARLSVLTGLAYKDRKFVASRKLKNFFDADEIESTSRSGRSNVWLIERPKTPSNKHIYEVKRNRGPKGHRRRHDGKPHQTAAPKPLNNALAQVAGLKLP